MHEVCRASGWIFSAVSVLTATAIGVDRLLAFLKGLRYRHVVTLTRVRVAIFLFLVYWCLYRIYPKMGNRYNSGVSLCHLEAFSGNVHFLSHKDTPQITTSTSPRSKQLSRTRRVFVTFLFVIGIENDLRVAWIITMTLVHLNSTFNPIFYFIVGRSEK